MTDFDALYEQMMAGDASGFPTLLAALKADDTRAEAACTVAELLYREALDNEQARAVEQAVQGWTREVWRSSWDTRYLSGELDKLEEQREDERANLPDPYDRVDAEYDRWKDER
jgi:hypothetical protein